MQMLQCLHQQLLWQGCVCILKSRVHSKVNKVIIIQNRMR